MDFVWADLEKVINEVLAERLVLKLGENGWDKYAELVGKAYGFDYINVGEIKGYNIKGKELVTKD